MNTTFLMKRDLPNKQFRKLVEFINETRKNNLPKIYEDKEPKEINWSAYTLSQINDAKEYHIMGLRELVEFEQIIGRRIQIHLFSRENIDTGIFNNIANGILLWGFLEVKK